MSNAFVDTNVLIRLLTGDDPGKQAAAYALFEQVENGALILRAPDTVIADAVFVLSSSRHYGLPRSRIRDALGYLVRLSNFQVQNRAALLQALDVYAVTNLDFGDEMLVGSMRVEGVTDLYSYDHDFDRFTDINRIDP